MQIPLQISFRNMDPSPAVEAVVREKAAKLDRFFERIVSCDVTIEAPHRHHHKGKLYKVRIDIGMPGMDGYETCRRLRTQPSAANAFIVALTGWGQDRDKQRAVDAGFDAHLTKPADPQDIERVLANAPLSTHPR